MQLYRLGDTEKMGIFVRIKTKFQAQRQIAVCSLPFLQSVSKCRLFSVPDRMVSISPPFLRPIVRGKAGIPVEFCAKLDISVVNGWTRLECLSFDAYNEAGHLQAMTKRFSGT